MNLYVALACLCLLIILSFLFDRIAARLRVPAVLFLIAAGVGLQLVADALGSRYTPPPEILELLGSVGLVLIVLEGALELHLSKEKLPQLWASMVAALVLLLATSWGMAMLIHYWTGAPFNQCWLNATPLAVISSAVVIPSVRNLAPAARAFLTYESTFSDIFGIILFNVLASGTSLGMSDLAMAGGELLLTMLASVLAALALFYFTYKVQTNNKYMPILAMLLLLYAVGKLWHLPVLILVLCFGLLLNNYEFLLGRFRLPIHTEVVKSELEPLLLVTSESAFFIRTFFFLVFGYSFVLGSLADNQPWIWGAALFAVAAILRVIYVTVVLRQPVVPTALIFPRGLISLLLFYSIPVSQKLSAIESGLLLVMIIATGFALTAGLVMAGKSPGKHQS